MGGLILMTYSTPLKKSLKCYVILTEEMQIKEFKTALIYDRNEGAQASIGSGIIAQKVLSLSSIKHN